MNTQSREKQNSNIPGRYPAFDPQSDEGLPPNESIPPFLREQRHWTSVVQNILDGDVPDEAIEHFAGKAKEYSRVNSFSEYVMPVGLDPFVGPAVLHEALRSQGRTMPPEDPIALEFQIERSPERSPRGSIRIRPFLIGFLSAAHSSWAAKLAPFGLEFIVAASPTSGGDSDARYVPREEDYVFLATGAAEAALRYRESNLRQ